MDKVELERIIKENEGIREAIKSGIPEEEAVKIFLESNRKVESGEWVELYKVEPRYGKSEYHPQSTSIIRYWGPKNLLEDKEQISRKQAEKFFSKGIVGKTHELVGGSGIFKQRYIKRGGRHYREIDASIRPSYPCARRVLHRHWEIGEMYKYQRKRKESLENRLLGVILLTLALGFFYKSLAKERSLVGYAVLDYKGLNLFIFLALILLAIYFLTIKKILK